MVIATLFIFIRLYIKLYLIRSKAYEDCKPVSLHPLYDSYINLR